MPRAGADSAGRAFLAAILDAVGCVTDARPERTSGSRDRADYAPFIEGREYSVASTDPMPLRSAHGGPAAVALEFQLSFVFGHSMAVPGPVNHPSRRSQSTSVKVTSYEFYVVGQSGIELLAYHWHPGERFGGPDHPHVHVSATLRDRRPPGSTIAFPLDKRHLVTGLGTLAAIVRMLIEEFDVAGRGDWDGTLRRAEGPLAAVLR